MKRKLIILICVLFSQQLMAEGILVSWGGKDLIGMTQERFEAAKSWTPEFIDQKIVTVDNWPEVYLLMVASSKQKDSVIDLLINHLTNLKETKLALTSRLIIWDRIITKDIFFEGKGLQIGDDLFTLAGRANWILRNLTKQHFGLVTPASTKQSMQELQAKWKKWRNNEAVETYKSPFASEEKGMDEINSLTAFEAIIFSLAPNDEKEAMIKNCLAKLYNLTEMPKDKTSPANFCSPDTYSHMYLSKLSGIKEEHDYGWWKNWWLQNSGKLVWNAEKAQFDIQG